MGAAWDLMDLSGRPATLYRAFNLLVRSPLALPGFVPAYGAQQADVEVRFVPPAPLPDEAPLYRLHERGLTFSPPGVGEYRVETDSIEVRPHDAADPEEVIALLLATALPALLWLRRDFVLHAAGVVPANGGGAVLIAGPSGVGKSTAAAQLMTDGAHLLADDSVRLVVNGGDIIASGLAGGLHLDLSGSGRQFASVDLEQSVASAPLRAIVILSRTAGEPSLTRVDPVAAIAHLLAHQHRPRVPALLGLRAHVLDICAVIAHRVPIYAWHRNAVALCDWEREALTLGLSLTE